MRENINAVGSNQSQADQFNEWVSELDGATNEITEIDDVKLPAAQNNLREHNNSLKTALKKLSLSWTK